jgi:ferredoxin
MNVDTLVSLAAPFTGEQLSVETQHCLNARWKAAACAACWQTCPTQAIRPVPGRSGGLLPMLDAAACVHCGLCLRRCPTGVFGDPSDKPHLLTETLKLLDPGPALLVCPRVSGEWVDAPAGVRAAVRAPRCLAAWGLADWIEMARTRPVILDDRPCAECPIGSNRAHFVRAAQQANRLLAAFDLSAAHPLQPATSCPALPKPAVVPILPGDQPAVSRRGFFAALKDAARQAADTAVISSSAGRANGKPAPVAQRLPHHLPAERRRLLEALGRIPRAEPRDEAETPPAQPFEAGDLPLADVQVHAAACTACGLCARFCPTAALRFVTEGERFGLSVRADGCIACGICAQACPTQAITLRNTLAPADVLANRPRWLAVGRLVACAACRAPTAEHGPGARCFACQRPVTL